MGLHDALEGRFKTMIKSSGHVKYFRHQCTTLIKICRHFWGLVAMMDADQYESFQKFVATADRALQAVAGFDISAGKHPDEKLQGMLDESIIGLKEYWERLSGSGDDNPETLMLEARIMDQERKRKIVSVDELKKIPRLKSEVQFYIHEGSGPHILTRLRICKQSTAEELLFKLGRNPDVKIKLHESACFYTRLVGKGNETKANNLDLMSSNSKYRPKTGFSDFGEYFNPKHSEPGPVHVFVDRKPSINILLTAKKWSRLFSMARLIDNDKVFVLKGVDGTLYHAQQVVDELIQSNATTPNYVVHRLDQQSGTKIRFNTELGASSCINILHGARNLVLKEDQRRAPGKWLVQIDSPLTNLPFDNWGAKPKIQYKDFDLNTTAGGSGTTGGSDATRRVREMVERLENERKEAEKKEKDKKGFFGRMFGRK